MLGSLFEVCGRLWVVSGSMDDIAFWIPERLFIDSKILCNHAICLWGVVYGRSGMLESLVTANFGATLACFCLQYAPVHQAFKGVSRADIQGDWKL
jgi:hypothetical protein